MPPHVFALDFDYLRYGHFARDEQGVELREYHSVELTAELFNRAALGATLREPAPFRERLRALIERISTPVAEASLVLPDAWFRISFTEVGELPRSHRAREEVLRWKLRRLVPFRVEDLRLSAAEVEPLAGQEEPKRAILGFALDLLVRQLEEAFAAEGVRIGQISNRSLSLLPALKEVLAGLELGLVAQVLEDGYSIVFTRRGEPVLHRHKLLEKSAPPSFRERVVLRDLRLTRNFLREQLGGASPGRVVLAAAREGEEVWAGWLEEIFERPAELLSREWGFLEERAPDVPAHEIAPMLGAACREVA